MTTKTLLKIVCGSALTLAGLVGCQAEDKPQGDRYAPRERDIAGQDAPDAMTQGGSSAKPSLNDASTPLPKGGMTVQPPNQPVGPTPSAGSPGTAGGNGLGSSR